MYSAGSWEVCLGICDSVGWIIKEKGIEVENPKTRLEANFTHGGQRKIKEMEKVDLEEHNGVQQGEEKAVQLCPGPRRVR